MPELGPLAEVDPDAMSAVFAADPLDLTDARLETLVIELRRRRNAYLAKEAVAALKPKRTRASTPISAEKAAAADTPPSEFNISDLLDD